MNSQDLIEINIEKVTYGGDALGYYEGKVVFVKNALPGDVVLARILKNKKSFMLAEVAEWIKKSSLRIPSRCKHSDECGGCQFQEVSYSDQLDWKKSFIVDSINRIAGLNLDNIELTGSPEELLYRNRIQIKIHKNKSNLKMGFYKKSSHEIIDIDSCAISEKPISDFIKSVREAGASLEFDKPFDLELQSVISGDGLSVIGIIKAHHSKMSLFEGFIQKLESFSDCLKIYFGDEVSKDYYLHDRYLGVDFYTQPGQFQQVSRKANVGLQDFVLSIIKKLSPKRVLDLYCGSGNFSLNLAAEGVEVTGVEYSKKAIESAQYNLDKNQIRAQYIAGDSTKEFKRLRASQGLECIIVDPPRSGLGDLVDVLAAEFYGDMVYISCDPTTLSRDLKVLISKGWRVEVIQGFDLFPMTYHVETVVHLKR